MAELEKGTKPDDMGDHAHYRTSEDEFHAQYASEPWGYTPIFSTVWSGPYLGALGAFPDISDRALEVKIWHPKGLLPTSILQTEQAKLMEMDPWLRELVCRIHLVDEKVKDGAYTYFTKIFVKFPDTGSQIEESARDGPCPLIEANNIRVDFESCPVVDTTGVRGHAKGLVTRALLERLDGTEHFGTHKMGTVRRPQIEFHVLPSAPRSNSRLTSSRHNSTVSVALRDTIFGAAKALEGKLRSTNDTSRSSRSLQRRGKPKTLAANKDGHPDKRSDKRSSRLVISSQVYLIPNDYEEALNSDGELFGKAAPVDDTESVTSVARLFDIATKISGTECVDAEIQSCKAVTVNISATESDKAKPSKKSRVKRIRSFLARLFCCAPKTRRKYPA